MALETDGMEHLLGVDDPVERRLALKSHLVDPYHLRLALKDEDPTVREAAARHPELTPELMHEVLNGDDRWLAGVVLSRPDLTEEQLEHALGHEDLRADAAHHPCLTEAQRQKLLGDESVPDGLKDHLQKSDVGIVHFPQLDKHTFSPASPSPAYTEVAPETFEAAISKHPNQESLDNPRDYTGKRTFLDQEGASGYALKGGELNHVFSLRPGLGEHAVRHAIGNGAKTLSAFDGKLPKYYARFGFQEQRREKNWTPGQPDVVYMGLSKNIGYLTYPNFDNDALRNKSAYFPQHYSKYRGGMLGGKTSPKEQGVHLSSQWTGSKTLDEDRRRNVLLARRVPKSKAALLTFMPDTPVQPVRQRLFGDAPAGGITLGIAGRPIAITSPEMASQMGQARRVMQGQYQNANADHEVQHAVFGRLGAKYGKEGRNKILHHTLARLDPVHEQTLRTLFRPYAKAYHILEHPEEQIAFMHNFLQDPQHRRSVFIHHRIHNNPEAQRQLQSAARQAWNALQRIGLSLDPTSLGMKVVKTEDAIAQYVETLVKSNSSDTSNVSDHLGYDHRQDVLLAAAEFLTGKPVDPAIFRARQLDMDDDVDAVLLAAGLSTEARPALEGVLAVSNLAKSDENLPKKAVPLHASATDLANDIQWSIDHKSIEHVHLGGKHSGGTLMAHDKDGALYLLKPGSGNQSPAKGAAQEAASPSQSRREVCYSQVARSWGILAVPEAQLLAVDGKEVACLKMLGIDWSGLHRARGQDPNLPRRVLQPLMADGSIHKWATLDFVLGNPDRHGNNLMVGPNGHVALIDHGSAFAGPSFDPARDNNSFVPYYLRIWGPDKGWSKMTPQQRLGVLPTLSTYLDEQLQAWIQDLDEEGLASILHQYGINPAPSLERLAAIKNAVAVGSASLALNRFWVV